MNIQEVRELLDILESKAPNCQLRLVINTHDVIPHLKPDYFTALENNAWNPVEVHVVKKIK